MKIKGKAIFELTNVETGEKRVVKEENMVTNAFQYLLNHGAGLGGGPQVNIRANNRSSGFYMMSTGSGSDQTNSYTARTPILRYTNGLLLFSDKLDEDPDHIHVTADDPDLVGVGAELAYIGNQTCAGSYNKTESGPIENGYKHVWDFTTSQANGDIGCACLTPIMSAGLGGGSGFPTKVSDWFGTVNSERDGYAGPVSLGYPPMYDYFQDPYMWTKGYCDFGRNLYIRPDEYFAFPTYQGSTSSWYVQNEFDVNGNVTSKKVFDRTFLYKKSINLSVYRLPYSNFSIFDIGQQTTTQRIYSGTSRGYTYEGQMPKLQTVTVNMPSGLAALIPDDKIQASINTSYYWPTSLNYDEGFMYISFTIPHNYGNGNGTLSLNSGDKIYVWKINMTTFESSYFTITNTTGAAIPMYYYSSVNNGSWQWIVTNDYTLLFSDPQNRRGTIWIIDNATGSTIKQVVDSNDNVYARTNTSSGYVVLDNILYFYPYGQSNAQQLVEIINLKTGYVRYSYTCGLYNYDIMGCAHGIKMPILIYNYASSSNQYYSATLNFFADTQLLMTINNLEDVVTKTSAETMKVTYIITQEEEE